MPVKILRLLPLLLFYSWMATGQNDAPAVRIACIGASITYGATLPRPAQDAYPQQLGRLLGSHYQVTNYGVSGTTLLRKGNLSYWSTTAYQAALQSSPDIVFIDLGGNDAKLINRVHIAEFENDYHDLIRSFEQLSTHPRIILLLPFPGFTKDTAQIWDPAIVSQIIPHIRQVAQDERLETLDMHSLFIDKESWMPDKVHPNLEGALLIARTMYSFLMQPEDTRRAGISDTYPTDLSDWQNAFLSGNGKMGIMVFGNPLHETIIFNDRKFNMAKTKDRSFAQVSPADIKKIKHLCADGHFAEANKLAVSSAQYSGGGEGNRHPGFEMRIDIPSAGEITRYSRICNFRTGEIIIKWTDDRGDWERKAFVSRKDNVIVQYLTAPGGGKLNCEIQLSEDPKMSFPSNMSFINASDTDWLNMRVKYPPNTDDAGYEGATRVIVSGGSKMMEGHVLHVSDARSVLLLTRTDKYYSDCESQWNRQGLQKELQTISPDYDELLNGQKATHGQIYDRVKLDLNASAEDRSKTNEELLSMQKNSPVAVTALWERAFDAGRYYFLSSSSELTPPDLLGIWTGDCNAGWGGFYHLDANANLQVAGGNIGDMPEAMEGYFRINEGWKAGFETNASKLLGCRGLLAAGNTPGTTTGLMASINDYYPYQYATGEEDWLLYPFWEHYLVTGDKKFLKERIYPLLREMGHFYEDFLKIKDRNGKYIFAGSVSPENQPENIHISLLDNSLFDISGAKFALKALIETCNILGTEQGQGQGVERWSRILRKLPPYLINTDGALQEWAWPGLKDHYDHRHSSQLLPVWPYREITPERTPTLFKAAAITLDKKDVYNYGNTGHGLLHSALIAAVLKNAGAVNTKLLRLTKEDFYFNSLVSSHNSGHNTFCTDACNTVPAIMMEMLVSSDPGVLELLPALPETLEKGEIAGIRGRNQVQVEKLAWDMPGHTIKCVIKSNIDQDLTLIVRKGIRKIETTAKIRPSALGEIARIIHLRAGERTNLAIDLTNTRNRHTTGVSEQKAPMLAGKRVLWVGASITQAGEYVDFAEYYLNRLYPQNKFDIISIGLASETVSGLTEKQHPFPRPNLLDRLPNALALIKPQIVVAADYGINDGIYHPLSSERMQAFQNGIDKLIAAVKGAHAKLILVTPGVFDSLPVKSALPASAPDFAYFAPYAGYDSVMSIYAKWEMTLNVPDVQVIDLHTPMEDYLKQRRKTDPHFAFSSDGIHPDTAGHLLMARTILKALSIPIDRSNLDAGLRKIEADPLFSLVAKCRRIRSDGWLAYVGYTRGETIKSDSIEPTEKAVRELQDQIDRLR